ncbi:hypothetical protein MNBD_NITROSPINAE02-757 [hydrothermal vent metagenome]|uniref:Uncharacterized protein n=1 Tax=hydrothermal vent metagenome TaxID=652676 RepID=A0A3B1CAT4_9ZZZZ
MYFGMKEVVLYGSLALVAALLVNHYAGLDVPALNLIEDSIVGEGDQGGADDEESVNVFDYANIDAGPGGDRECVTARKMAGDAKTRIRAHMVKARAERDEDTISALEDKLQKWRERIDAACDKG